MAHASESFPKDLGHAYLFAVFNAFSFQIVLNSPMVLYAKSLGASATVLGILAGMMPLLVVFQIPAARHVVRIGYKKFVYAGWGVRVMFIFGMAIVPVLSFFLSAMTQLALLLLLLFGFNLSRGISSCAWLPWITSLIPTKLRGKYLVREAACVNVASFATFLLAAFCLGQSPKPWQFAALFAFSALMGMSSLFFLKRIPESESSDQFGASTTPVPWGEIIRFEPFQKLLWMNFAWAMAYGGLTAFVVAFLKTQPGFHERTILIVTAMSFIGGIGSLGLLGHQLDRVGSKPVLLFAFGLWLLILAGWSVIAGGWAKPSIPLIVLLQLAMGLATSLVNTANLRLAMATIPVMGRNHFFALYSVVSNLTQGVAPVIWGLMIDLLGPVRFLWLSFDWNRFSLFFMAVEGVIIVTLLLCRRLDEPEARSMEEMLRDLLQSPIRFWMRVWPRG
jgi:MFS family permease